MPDGVRIHCAAAVSVLGEPFPDVAAARDAADGPGLRPRPGGRPTSKRLLRAGLHELGRLPAERVPTEVFRAAEAGHDALSALR